VETVTSHELRCPKCGAHALAAADWCTLCYADLRPPAEPEQPREPELPEEPVATADSTPATPEAGPDAPAIDSAGSRGKHARQASTQGSDTTDGATGELPANIDVELMLAQLAAETPAPLASLMDRFDTKASRALAICGGVLAVGVVLLVAMTIIGSVI
jgi:hypothetical protein